MEYTVDNYLTPQRIEGETFEEYKARRKLVNKKRRQYLRNAKPKLTPNI
jgi:hypothetical protein